MGNNDNDITVLIKKSQRGDAAAMEELLRAAYTPVYYQCRRFLKTGADAEDMTQEVLLLLYTKLDTLKEPAAFWGWLGRLTANRCKNALTRTHADLPILEDEEGNSVLDAIESGDRTAVPEEAFDNAETARMIGGIVDALPEAQRDCVLLYYYDEMSVKEIAGVTGVAENTVKSRLNYARKTIKENVLDYEKKQGIRLHSLAPVPLLYYFLHMDAQACADAGKAEQAVSKVMGQAAAASAAPLSGPAAHPAATTAAHALQGISIKTAAVAAAGLLLIGGTAAGIVTALNHGKEEAAEVYAPIETGTPDGGDAVADTAEPEKTEEPAAAREGPLFPEEALAALPYTGDTGQCAMTMEQAEAFAGALDSCIAESREEGYDVPFCRAALFDAGNGIPALFVAWGADAGYGDDSGCMADVSRIYCWDGREASAGAGGRLGEIHGDTAVTDKGLLTDAGFYTFTDGMAELAHTYEDFFLYGDTAPSLDKFREYIAEHGVFEGTYDFGTLTEDKWQIYQYEDYDNWPEDGYSGLLLSDEYGSLVSSLDGVFLTRSEAEAAGQDMAWYLTWQDWNLGNGHLGASDVSWTWAGDWMDAEELAALLRGGNGTAAGSKAPAPENAAVSTEGNIRRTAIDSRGHDIEIWYEIPDFPEDTDGYKTVNAFFEGLQDAFLNDDSGGLADLWDIVEGNPPQSENYYYTVSAEIKSQTAQYVSVIQTQEIYLGGIRESESRYYNFRTDTGEALLLTDILEGTADQITEQIADAVAIADPYTEETGALDNIRGRDIGEFDFYISDGHIHLSFDTYDLYGTSYGGDPPVEVELPAELRAEWR